MTTTTRKQPADHKEKQETQKDLEHFSFEHDGETYTFEGSLKEITKPGFVRKNRAKEEMDVLFNIFELIAGEEALAVIDEMEQEEFAELVTAFSDAVSAYQGATLGES